MEFEDDPLRVNPWSVGSLEDFLVYSCPECMTFERTVNAFVEHATNKHPSCHELMVSLGFFEPEPRVKKETLGKSEHVISVPDGIREQNVILKFVTDAIREQPVTPAIPNKPVQPIQLQNEVIDVSKIKTEHTLEESLPFLPLMDIESNNECNEESSASIESGLNTSEHETSAVLRAPSVIFFEKLVPAKAKIQANIWEDRTEIPSGPKENVMYVMKNFNKDRKGRYKNPSCDYGPWKGSSHTNQYQIKDNTLQWIGKSDDHDYGIKDCEKVVLKNSRCYLHADPKYIKMVTYIKQCPDDYISAKDYCTVEYVGKDLFGPNTKPHGNSKNGISYKRSNPYILEEAKEKIKKGKMSVKEVLSELNDSSIGQTMPSARAISDLKTELKKEERKREQLLISEQIKIENDDL